jgi:predicted nucleic acid-binding protein
VEPAIGAVEAKRILRLSELHGLTVYDAAYLELAMRKGLELATLDDALIRVAPLAGVSLVSG